MTNNDLRLPMISDVRLREVPGAWKGIGRHWAQPLNVPVNCAALIGLSQPNLQPLRWPAEMRPVIDGVSVEDWYISYQIQGVRFAAMRRASYFYWAGGAGKTAAAIVWALLHGGRVVIVTKANTKRQWKLEWQRLTTLRDEIAVLSGQGGTVPEGARIVILNWEIVPHWVDELIAWGGSYSAIFDELHRAKNWKRTEKCVDSDATVKRVPLKNVSTTAAKLGQHAARTLGLSATPIRDRVSDWWSQGDILEYLCWGTNWEFVHQYCAARRGTYGGIDTSGQSNVPELKARMRTMMHTVSREELERSLPAKRRQIAYLDPEDQCRPSGGFKAEFKRAASRGPSAILEMRFAEAASRKRRWIILTTLDAMEAGQKVVIFTGRRRDCKSLGKALAKKCEVRALHGGDTTAEREDGRLWYVEHPGPCVLVGTHDAWGEAVDGLQCTDLALFAMLPWTPGAVTQSEARFSRHGQTRPVLIMYVVASGTVDERVSELLLEKVVAVRDTLDDTESGQVAAVLSGEADEDAIVASILEDFVQERT